MTIMTGASGRMGHCLILQMARISRSIIFLSSGHMGGKVIPTRAVGSARHCYPFTNGVLVTCVTGSGR